jgi:DNA-binding NarL/FixJ family response regulator
MSISIQGIDVLIVDNADLVKTEYINLLGNLPIVKNIHAVTSYEEAVLAIQDRKPHIVFADVDLPGRSGLELLHTIKIIDRNIKVVMVSSALSTYYKDLCYFLKAEDLLHRMKDFEVIPDLMNRLFQFSDN